MKLKNCYLLLFLMAILVPFTASGKAPSRFTNVGFAYTNMKQGSSSSVHSDLGFSLSKATTYYLHKPIAGKLLFGIEAVWTDLTYSNYKVNYISLAFPEDNETRTIHTLDYTLQGGLGINYAIVKDVNLHAYARYAPGFSGIYHDSTLMGGFLNSADFGLIANWKFIGLGVDYRFGQSKHKSILPQFDFDDDSISVTNEKIKTKINGWRFFVSLTF